MDDYATLLEDTELDDAIEHKFDEVADEYIQTLSDDFKCQIIRKTYQRHILDKMSELGYKDPIETLDTMEADKEWLFIEQNFHDKWRDIIIKHEKDEIIELICDNKSNL